MGHRGLVITAIVFIVMLLLASTAYAKYRSVGARTLDGFCDGIRYDGQSYEDFIDDHANNQHHACAWRNALYRAQKSICGQSVFINSSCSR